jgi:hypothetical protein
LEGRPPVQRQIDPADNAINIKMLILRFTTSLGEISSTSTPDAPWRPVDAVSSLRLSVSAAVIDPHRFEPDERRFSSSNVP